MSTIRFTPGHYPHTFGAHPAVCQLEPGDTLITTTLDAHGFDAGGSAVMHTSNPLTGPFAIRGAQAGDTLAVTLKRLDITRSSGFSYRNLRPNTVPPQLAAALPPREEMRWHIDLQKSIAVPDIIPAALPNFSIPLHPMLGCIGVAPFRNQFISSYTCGNFGGNLDSALVAAGTTLYLPVFEKDALLFIGDGHAAQSHGELPGTGIEVPMEVELQVDVIHGKSIDNPRGENDTLRFTIGVDRPLEYAMQLATAEMLAWLQEDPGLTLDEACLILGQVAAYEIGNVISPYYSMACRFERRLLS